MISSVPVCKKNSTAPRGNRCFRWDGINGFEETASGDPQFVPYERATGKDSNSRGDDWEGGGTSFIRNLVQNPGAVKKRRLSVSVEAQPTAFDQAPFGRPFLAVFCLAAFSALSKGVLSRSITRSFDPDVTSSVIPDVGPSKRPPSKSSLPSITWMPT